jgi:phage terminase small subunit
MGAPLPATDRPPPHQMFSTPSAQDRYLPFVRTETKTPFKRLRERHVAMTRSTLDHSAPPAVRRQALPKPPKHLTPETAKWWRGIVQTWELEPHSLRILQAAAEAWDRLQQARQVLADHGGLTIEGARGGLLPHPAVAIERDARTGFARLVRELELDAEPPASPSRPPALRRHGRR